MNIKTKTFSTSQIKTLTLVIDFLKITFSLEHPGDKSQKTLKQ